MTEHERVVAIARVFDVEYAVAQALLPKIEEFLDGLLLEDIGL